MSYNTNVKLPCVIRELQFLSEASEGNRPINTLGFPDEMANLGTEVRLLSGLPSSGYARRINTFAQLSVVQEVYYYCTV